MNFTLYCLRPDSHIFFFSPLGSHNITLFNWLNLSQALTQTSTPGSPLQPLQLKEVTPSSNSGVCEQWLRAEPHPQHVSAEFYWDAVLSSADVMREAARVLKQHSWGVAAATCNSQCLKQSLSGNLPEHVIHPSQVPLFTTVLPPPFPEVCTLQSYYVFHPFGNYHSLSSSQDSTWHIVGS